MHRKIRLILLLIAFVQALHSCEEWIGKIWEVYPPAIFFCSLVSSNLAIGFVVINMVLFGAMMLTWLSTAPKMFTTGGVLWFWISLEMANGLGHIFWAITRFSYVPGLLTAPILVFLAFRLARLLLKKQRKLRQSKLV